LSGLEATLLGAEVGGTPHAVIELYLAAWMNSNHSPEVIFMSYLAAANTTSQIGLHGHS